MSKKNLKEGLFRRLRSPALTNFGRNEEKPDLAANHARIGADIDSNYDQSKKLKTNMAKLVGAANRRKSLKKLKEDITQAIGDGTSIAGVNRNDIPGRSKRILRRR